MSTMFRHGNAVPVIKQTTQSDCGAACLTALLAFHGRHCSLFSIREQLGTNRDGVTAAKLLTAARAHGMTAKAFSVAVPQVLSTNALPVIAFYRRRHFVVVERCDARHVWVMDPSSGEQRLSMAEFSALFGGVVLLLEPGPAFEQLKPNQGTTVATYLRGLLAATGSASTIVQILLASAVLQALGLAGPWLTRYLVDDVVPAHGWKIMPTVALGILLLVLAQVAGLYLRAVLLIRLETSMDALAVPSLIERLLRLPLRFFQMRNTGDLMMRLGSHAAIRESLTVQTISGVLDGVMAVVFLAALFLADTAFGWAAVIIGIVQVSVLAGTARWLHGLSLQSLAATTETHAFATEMVAGIATLKASGREANAFAQWQTLFEAQLNLGIRRSLAVTTLQSGLGVIRIAAPLALLWLGIQRVIDGQMTLGAMLALNSLAVSYLMPLAALVALGQNLQTVRAHVNRLADLLESSPEQEVGSRQVSEAPRLQGYIELRNVSFRYEEAGPKVLDDISFSMAPGQKVAIIGPTGSGKSTLANLLLGLYQPSEGEIRYDGLRAGSIELRSLRRQFGVVLQESHIFAGSIAQNIAFHMPGVASEQIQEAARQACIHEEIKRMPMSYDTMLSENGAGISGGQRQRLAIARALLQDPAILLLDEGTSHLDPVTEARVNEELANRNVLRIVIAHRLSTVRDADWIVVLDRGRIVEQGTPKSLLGRGGYYAEAIRQSIGDGPPAAELAPVA